jgi:hypothetical protein
MNTYVEEDVLGCEGLGDICGKRMPMCELDLEYDKSLYLNQLNLLSSINHPTSRWPSG